MGSQEFTNPKFGKVVFRELTQDDVEQIAQASMDAKNEPLAIYNRKVVYKAVEIGLIQGVSIEELKKNPGKIRWLTQKYGEILTEAMTVPPDSSSSLPPAPTDEEKPRQN